MRVPDKKPINRVEEGMTKLGWEPTRWWHAISPEGDMLAETSDPSDFESLDLPEGYTTQRLYQRVESKWINDRP